MTTRESGGRHPPVPMSVELDGFDCGSSIATFTRLWQLNINGKRYDPAVLALWAAHTKPCGKCRGWFRELAQSVGLTIVSTRVIKPIYSVVRDTAGCSNALNLAMSWVGGTLVGSDGKSLDPAVRAHFCGCFGCKQLFDIFGEEVDTFFGV